MIFSGEKLTGAASFQSTFMVLRTSMINEVKFSIEITAFHN